MLKQFFIVFCLILLFHSFSYAACDCGDAGDTCQGQSISYTRDGETITFEFNCSGGDCYCGKFANDWDYWVAPMVPGNDVTITTMTPTETGSGTTLRNGAMQDPTGMELQGFHGGDYSDDGKLSILTSYDASVMVSPPMIVNIETLGRPSTIIKSDAAPDATCNGTDRICISYFETLTVLNTPPGNVFRPPFFGTEKPLIPYSNYDDSILSNVTGIGTATWSRAYELVQSVHIGAMSALRQPAQGLNAAVNDQTDDGYDAYITQKLNAAILKLAEDPGEDSALKRSIAISIAQRGIDLYYISKNGANAPGSPYDGYGDFSTVPCGAWVAAGGYNQGYLTPILFSAALLNKSEWITALNSMLSTRDSKQCFGETGFIQENVLELGKGVPTFGHLNTDLYLNIGDCNGSNRNCASVGGSSLASYDLYDGLADGDPLSNTGSPTAYQVIVTGENFGAAIATWLTPAVYDNYPQNAKYWLEFMDRAKRLGDSVGDEYFGSYNNVATYDYNTYKASYIPLGSPDMWTAYKDCIGDQSCAGMTFTTQKRVRSTISGSISLR